MFKPVSIQSLLIAAFTLLTLPALAQVTTPRQNPRAPQEGSLNGNKPIQVDVELALANVTVTDPYNRLVPGLEKDNFRVFEDGTEQEVVHFASEDVPISIGIILDMSGSMLDKDKVGEARQAAAQFLKTANPRDEFFLVTFNDRARLVTRFTTSVEDLQNSLITIPAKGRTALLDGIYLGLSEMRSAHNAKRALLIISDGGDNHSRYSEADIQNFVKEADCQLYAIGVYGGTGKFAEERYGPTLLAELAGTTGGRMFNVNSLKDLPDIASKIGMELRNQYVLGYKPSNEAHDGTWRNIKVSLVPPRGLPPLNAYAKTGYYAPKQ